MSSCSLRASVLVAMTLAGVLVGASAAGADPVFTDVTQAKGITGAWDPPEPPEAVPARAGGAAVLDYDLDGDEDLYVTHNDNQANQLYRNDGGSGFVDMAGAAGVGFMGRTLGALAADFDNDGDPDLLLCNETANVLYENLGNGTFADATAGSGLDLGATKVTYAAAVADYDLDGNIDLYLANWEPDPLLSGNELWRNLGGLQFADVTSIAGVGDDSQSLACTWNDVDLDGDPDIYSVNEFDPDKLYRNDGGGGFVDVTTDVLFPAQSVEDGDGMGVHFADYDGDGLQDFYVANFGPNNLYHNNGDGTFTDLAQDLGCSGPTTSQRIGWGIEFTDCDLDGDLDIFVANGRMTEGTNNDLYIYDGVAFTAEPGAGGADQDFVSRGSVLADFDRDGDQDIFVINHDPDQTPGFNCYYENIQATGHHWIRVSTRGVISNADGVGARVSVHVGSEIWVREVTIGSSFASSSSPIVHFGLGTHGLIDSVRVVWPSGTVDLVTNVTADQTLPFVEGSGVVAVADGSVGPNVAPLSGHPNPTPGTSRVTFELTEAQPVRVGVYTADGRQVRSLFAGVLDAGGHALTWDGRGADGARAGSGVYFIRLDGTSSTQVLRLVVLH